MAASMIDPMLWVGVGCKPCQLIQSREQSICSAVSSHYRDGAQTLLHKFAALGVMAHWKCYGLSASLTNMTTAGLPSKRSSKVPVLSHVPPCILTRWQSKDAVYGRALEFDHLHWLVML
jgi:hypothetical protein